MLWQALLAGACGGCRGWETSSGVSVPTQGGQWVVGVVAARIAFGSSWASYITIGSVLIRLATKRSNLKKSFAAALVQEVLRKGLICWAGGCNTAKLCWHRRAVLFYTRPAPLKAQQWINVFGAGGERPSAMQILLFHIYTLSFGFTLHLPICAAASELLQHLVLQ